MRLRRSMRWHDGWRSTALLRLLCQLACPVAPQLLMIHPDRVLSGSIVIAVTVAEPVTDSRGERSTEARELPTDEGVPPPLVYPLSPPFGPANPTVTAMSIEPLRKLGTLSATLFGGPVGLFCAKTITIDSLKPPGVLKTESGAKHRRTGQGRLIKALQKR